MRKYIIGLLSLCASTSVMAQAPRTAYHVDGFVYGHNLNPAFHSDSSYFSLPILGNTSISMSSSTGLGSFVFDGSDGKLKLFTSPGTISKDAFLRKIGSTYRNNFNANLELISLGRRVNERRYQTLSVSLKATETSGLDKGLFQAIKSVESGYYTISNSTVSASLYAEVAVGESRQIDSHWTVGAKAKLLVGLLNMDAEIKNMQLSLAESKWTASGTVTMNASGIDYSSTTEEYKTEGRGTYERIDGINFGRIGFHGAGLAFDLGASYKLDDNWKFSASVLDLGFISWFNSRKAVNGGTTFEFDGFHNVSAKDPSEDYGDYPKGESFNTQADRLVDDLMDLIHLEDQGKKNNTRMLSVGMNLGAQYKIQHWNFGALLSSRIQGKASWVEGRLSATYSPIKCLDITLAPSYSTYGFAMGALANYHSKKGYHVFLGSDCLFFLVNRQMIPTSLNGSINFGAAFPF